jgi:hypothetical protein
VLGANAAERTATEPICAMSAEIIGLQPSISLLRRVGREDLGDLACDLDGHVAEGDALGAGDVESTDGATNVEFVAGHVEPIEEVRLGGKHPHGRAPRVQRGI